MFNRHGRNGIPQTVTTQVGKEGDLKVTANGVTRTVVPKNAARAWVLKGEQVVVYSYREKVRGYEGEGEGLFRYDIATGKQAQILAAHYMVDKVYELTTAGGKSLLCVTMSDSGLGANHIAIVNPDQGTVFANPMSRFVKVEPGKIVVAEWGDADRWTGGDNPKGSPTRYYTFVPDRVLRERAVRNRPWQ